MARRPSFNSLGFHVVATLPGWVMDRDGHMRDLIIMAFDLRSAGPRSRATLTTRPTGAEPIPTHYPARTRTRPCAEAAQPYDRTSA